MNIKRISVKDLFGFLSYEVALKHEECATIIHAPNGYGKTTVLEILHGFLSLDLGLIHRHTFSLFTVEFCDGDVVTVTKIFQPVQEEMSELSSSSRVHGMHHGMHHGVHHGVRGVRASTISRARADLRQREQEPILRFDVQSGSGTPKTHEFTFGDIYVPDEASPHERARMLQRQIPWLDRIGPSRFMDTRSGESLGAREVMDRYAEYLGGMASNAPDWIHDIVDQCPSALIKTKRLDAELLESEEDHPRRNPHPRVLSVEHHSREMQHEIQQALSAFSDLSQELDRGLPKRLIRALQAKTNPTQSKVRLEFEKLDAKYTRIVEAGILESSRIDALLKSGEQKLATRRVLDVYAKDQHKKLKVFDALLAKIEAVRGIINRRYMHKRLDVSRETGYSIVSDRGDEIPLNRLSSGEQHQLVLFHQLLFGMTDGSLVMIDEPEISLHVAWQEEFLGDVARIAKNTGTHFLIATHSPQIVSDRWDLTVDLSEKEPRA
jgi:ABC-type cobalamin/Fe3+-siderophores transport system ATPase subunit